MIRPSRRGAVGRQSSRFDYRGASSDRRAALGRMDRLPRATLARLTDRLRPVRALLLAGGDPAHDLVDQAVFLGLDGGQVAVAFGVPGDPLDRLAGVLGQDLVDHLLALDDLLGLDLDVGDLAAHLAVGLMDHDLGVRQGEPLALGPAGQEDRGARGGQADAVGRDRALDELHRVVDRQGAGDAAARAVDVEADPLGAVLVLEEQELHDGQVGHGVVDHPFEEDDAVLEEQVAEGHLALPRVVAIALEQSGRRAEVRRHGTVLRNQGPLHRRASRRPRRSGRFRPMRRDATRPGRAAAGVRPDRSSRFGRCRSATGSRSFAGAVS